MGCWAKTAKRAGVPFDRAVPTVAVELLTVIQLIPATRHLYGTRALRCPENTVKQAVLGLDALGYEPSVITSVRSPGPKAQRSVTPRARAQQVGSTSEPKPNRNMLPPYPPPCLAYVVEEPPILLALSTVARYVVRASSER